MNKDLGLGSDRFRGLGFGLMFGLGLERGLGLDLDRGFGLKFGLDLGRGSDLGRSHGSLHTDRGCLCRFGK